MKKAFCIFLIATVNSMLLNTAIASFTIKAGSEISSGCGSKVRLHVEPTWEIVDPAPTTSILNQVFFLNKDTGFVSGYDGTLLRTYNGGLSWDAINTLTNGQSQPSPLTTLTFNTPKRGFALSTAGDFYTTWDGGGIWKKITTAPHATLKRLCFANEKIGFALNDQGQVLKTTDGGDNWVLNYTPVGASGLHLNFPSADTGYIANYNGYLAKTTDGGLTWMRVGNDLPSVSNSLYALHFTNPSTGYWGCNFGLFKTTNGGTTWSLILTTGKGVINNIRFFSDSVGYMVGKNGLFMKTLDAGSTWYSQNDFGSSALFDLCFPSATTGFLVGFMGSIYKCTARNIDSCRWEPAAALDNPNSRYPLADPFLSRTFRVTAYLNGDSATDQIIIDTTSLTLDLGANSKMVPGASRVIFPKHNYIGTVPLRYKWTPSTGLSSDSTAFPNFTMKDPITYSLTITTPGGCTASDTIRFENTNLTVSNGGEIWGYCGDSVQLFISTNYNGLTPLRYRWTPSVGLSCDTIARPMAKVGNITYTLTVQTSDRSQTATTTAVIRQVTPAAPEICMVTVDNQMRNTLYWNNYSYLINYYSIYKESNVTDVYSLAGMVSAKGLCSFTDTASNAEVRSYKYKLSATDLSGIESVKSIAHKSLHLTINKGIGKNWNLIWQAYEGFTVQSYEIYRGTRPDSMELIGTCSGSNTAFTDLNAPIGSLYYQMAILSPNAYIPNLPAPRMVGFRSMSNSQAVLPPTTTRIKSNLAFNQVNGLAINSLEKNLVLYPNPASEWIQVRNQLPEGEAMMLRIFEMTGKLVQEQKCSDKLEFISVSNLKPGMYLVKIQTGDSLLKGKLIIR
ncbi:MAG: YCF48-related protein [Bacteroidia bacterium]|nr:YCF48-related protein [Bacteroidia bacterium]